MTFIDTRYYYLENEELVEGRETEREELKEGAEGKEWVKLLNGSFDQDILNQSFQFHQNSCFHEREINQLNAFLSKENLPLFLKYCCLKIHLG